jgi:hypothetical protein
MAAESVVSGIIVGFIGGGLCWPSCPGLFSLALLGLGGQLLRTPSNPVPVLVAYWTASSVPPQRIVTVPAPASTGKKRSKAKKRRPPNNQLDSFHPVLLGSVIVRGTLTDECPGDEGNRTTTRHMI